MDSATPCVRMHSPPLPPSKCFTRFLSEYGHGYDVEKIYFNTTIDGVTEYFIMLVFRTPDKKGEVRVSNISLWEILCDDDNEAPRDRQIQDTVHAFTGGDQLRDIHCKAATSQMKEMPRKHASKVFTTNDMAALDSFTRVQSKPRCLEYSVMCVAKTLHNKEFIAAMSDDDLVKLVMTSPFIKSDMLRDVLEDRENYERFTKRAPPGLSREEAKDHEKTALANLREREVKGMEPKMLKALVMRWEKRNLTLDPDSKPAIFKDEVGQKLIMSKESVESWDKLSGLLFLLATTKLAKESPVNLAFALTAAKDTFIAEVTPKDERYGVKPPKLDGNKEHERLDWCAETPAGKLWLVKLTKSHGAEQEAFIAKFKAEMDAANECSIRDVQTRSVHIESALDMLTDGLNEYKFGILGLVKAIALRIFTGQIVLNGGFKNRIDVLLKPYGIDWWFHDVHATFNTTEQDPFELLCSVSSELE